MAVSKVDPLPFSFVDLFAGIGGMRLAFDSVGGRCAFTNEWNKFAARTYADNYGGDVESILGDIREADVKARIPSHDVLVAGFPCQPFSLAGVSKKNALGRPHGFACESQGTLFFEIATVLRDHAPKAFLLENVKHLERHDKGETFRVIKQTLSEELGYRVQTRVIDAAHFVPQHRERIIIVGFSGASDFSFSDLRLPPVSDGPRLGAILHPEDGSEEPELPYTDEDGKVSSRYTLTLALWTYLQEYAAKHRRLGNGFGFSLVGPEDTARTLSARYYKDGSEILIRQDENRRPRRLTPRECARLMGFDPPTTDTPVARRFRINPSDTQAYRQLGNAVVPQVIEAVAQLIVPGITGQPVANRDMRQELTLT